MRRSLVLLASVAFALSACGSDDKPAPATTPTSLDKQMQDLLDSWCNDHMTPAEATRQATDGGLTSTQAQIAVEQYEALMASSDEC